MNARAPQKTIVVIGGSGLIGGTLVHHFKSLSRQGVRVLSPNSKELSLRVPDDIRRYFESVKPDAIVNCAIAGIDSDPELTFEVSALGAVHLGRVACELNVPFIHFSSGALMRSGRDVDEADRLPLGPALPNYAKGKLLAELALERLHETLGLDLTIVRLGIVYGAHDHKIQGFHHLLFSLVEESMPLLLTRRGCVHSYTNASKLPAFVAHVLEHRAEFRGQILHFVDPEPVPLDRLILTIKALLGTTTPRAIYVPQAMARLLAAALTRVMRAFTRIGITARPPAELVFLKNFYESQALSCAKLLRSSFVDERPEETIFTALPGLIEYYERRWERLRLIEPRRRRALAPESHAELFAHRPERALDILLDAPERPFLTRCSLATAPEEREAMEEHGTMDAMDGLNEVLAFR